MSVRTAGATVLALLALGAAPGPAGAGVPFDVTPSVTHAPHGAPVTFQVSGCFSEPRNVRVWLIAAGPASIAFEGGAGTADTNGFLTLDATVAEAVGYLPDLPPFAYDSWADCGIDGITYDQFTFTVDLPASAPTSSGSLTPSTSSVAAGEPVAVTGPLLTDYSDGSGDGFIPGQEVRLVLYPGAIEVGTATAGSGANALSTSVTIPPGTDPGSYTLVAFGEYETVVPSFTALTTPLTVVSGSVADLDGDGDSDRSVFRNGAWFAEGQPPGFFGQAGDIPVPADYDGDGEREMAVFRSGAWYVEGVGSPTFFGFASDIPIPGDYDGDGDADIAVYRPSAGGWYVNGGSTTFFGLSSDIPVPSDYNGDGATDIAVWRPSVGGWYVNGQATQFLGLSGDIPVPGDYDGSGDTERAIWRPAVGGWYVEGAAAAFVGLSGDRPMPGDYDGNGTTDRAIWRPAVGGWYTQSQATVFLGLSGDIPLPLPHAIYRSFF